MRVAVIGAGVSGLAAARCLKAEGIEPVIFEQAEEIGGVWNFHEEAPGGGGPAYRSLRTNTSRQTTGFSDFPFPSSLPDYPSRAQVLGYLNAYADRFGVRDLVRLRTRVEHIRPVGPPEPSHSGTTAWEVTYRSVEPGTLPGTGAGKEQNDAPCTERFVGVMVCSGLYGPPVTPRYPGLEDFGGQVLHSRDYVGPEGFEGKDVVVVGTGSSGADIAVELSRVTRSLNLSTEKGAWFIPRYIGDRPYDHSLTRIATLVPYRLRMRLFHRLLFAEYRRMGISNPREALARILPGKPLDVLADRLTTSSDLPKLIADGIIRPRPAIARLEGQDVVYADGARDRADAVILATGYVTTFPFLDPSLVEVSGGGMALYKQVFSPDLPGLAFIGQCVVAGPVIPVIEMQARWAARVFSGELKLPAREQMRAETMADQEHMARMGARPMRVQLLEYMDNIARRIGVRPKAARLARNPALAWRVLAGAPVAAQYRLDGPGRWNGAEHAISEANRRHEGRGEQVATFAQPATGPGEPPVLTARRTRCCVVGGGPGGMVLALLLARRGVDVTLLEAQQDFDRDFRGDTIHPSTMEIMDQLGLAERILALPHSTVSSLSFETPEGVVDVADFRHLNTKYPYITLLPQSDFLDFLAGEAARYPNFHLVMGANVQGLIEEGGAVRGVRYRSRDGAHEVRALLTVGADGRFSKVRKLAGIEPVKQAPPMDVLWFRLPRRPGDPSLTGASIRLGPGRMLILLERAQDWQIGYVIAKGSYNELRKAGLAELQRDIEDLVPELAGRVDALKSWKQVSLLSVESSRVRRWYRRGLLLIGDAAHVMSPVGGVGINYAIQDAVVAANVLAGPLKEGRMRVSLLAEVQRRRELPTRFIQALQGVAQNSVVTSTIEMGRPFSLPRPARYLLRLPVLRNIPARIIGFGLRRVSVE